MTLEIFLLIWFTAGGCIVNSIIAKERGVDQAGTLEFSILFTPIIGFMYVIGHPPKPQKP